MKYSTQNDIRIVEVPVKDFRVILYDQAKKSMGLNRCNAGFFATYSEQGEKFTLPVAHLVADFSSTSAWTLKYCRERGKFSGSKFTFDASKWSYENDFRGKAISTLIVKDGKATIEDVASVPSCQYAISGVPVLVGGKFYGTTKAYGQGWDASSLYATWHIFVGLKTTTAEKVYVMALKTTAGNLLSNSAVANKFKALKFWDVIKLDGGGSFYFNPSGAVLSTGENRRVCSIIEFGATDGNPYAVPTALLYKYVRNVAAVCWLQWELNDRGYPLDVDGSFGNATLAALKAFQKDAGLKVDGYCGPATRGALTK